MRLPNLDALGLGAAVRLASGVTAPGLSTVPQGLWGAASEVSNGKDTPSGHWELAGLPVPWDWHYFPDTQLAFPVDLTQAVAQITGTDGAERLKSEGGGGYEVGGGFLLSIGERTSLAPGVRYGLGNVPFDNLPTLGVRFLVFDIGLVLGF